MDLNFHHIAISVRNLEKSKAFYERLGFKEIHRWDADDNSLAIVHLRLGTVVLEIFAYTENKTAAPLVLEVANDLSTPGVKHFGLQVSDVRAMLTKMQEAGYELSSPEVKSGRIKIDYFFIKDPDGMWVEIVQDDRVY